MVQIYNLSIMLSGLQSYLKLKGKHQHLNNNPLDTGGILLSLDRPIITNEQSSRTVGSRTIKRKNFRRIRAENMGCENKEDVLYGRKEKYARQYNKYRKEDHYLDEIDCDNDITVDRGMVLRNEEPPETISPENFKHVVHENGSIQQLGRWTRETRRLCLETFIKYYDTKERYHRIYDILNGERTLSKFSFIIHIAGLHFIILYL